MMSNYLSDEEIQTVLGDYDAQTAMVRENINALSRDLSGLSDDIYEYMSWYDGGGMAERPAGAKGNNDPVSLIVEKKDRELRLYRKELLRALAVQTARLDHIRKIHIAYLSLGAEEYLVMRTLYEERVPWKAAAEKLCFSKRKMLAVRKHALDRIRAHVERMEVPHSPDEDCV